jgi:hypothetical protein
MTELLLPEGVALQPEEINSKTQERGVEYKATEDDEERFFLIYHLNIQPSEAEALSRDYRKWLIMRFIAQKHMEQDAVDKQRLMRQFNQNPSVMKA